MNRTFITSGQPNEKTSAMKKAITMLLSSILGQIAFGAVYELQNVATNPGKLDNLNARFRDHTVGLFKKHGIESVGYWVPTDGEKFEEHLDLRNQAREQGCGQGIMEGLWFGSRLEEGSPGITSGWKNTGPTA